MQFGGGEPEDDGLDIFGTFENFEVSFFMCSDFG